MKPHKLHCPSCNSTNVRKHRQWNWMRVCNDCGHAAALCWFEHPERAAKAYTTAIYK